MSLVETMVDPFLLPTTLLELFHFSFSIAMSTPLISGLNSIVLCVHAACWLCHVQLTLVSMCMQHTNHESWLVMKTCHCFFQKLETKQHLWVVSSCDHWSFLFYPFLRLWKCMIDSSFCYSQHHLFIVGVIMRILIPSLDWY